MDRFSFLLDGEVFRERRRWASAANRRSSVGTAEGEAKRYAREHGTAGVWNADDTVLVFTRTPKGTISRRLHRNPEVQLPEQPRRLPSDPPFSADLHVLALGNGYTMLKLYTEPGRTFVIERRQGVTGNSYIAQCGEIAALSTAATDAGLRVRFN